MLKDALSQKKPEIVQELFKTKQVTGLTPEEGEALLELIPKTEGWELVDHFIKTSIIKKYPIIRPSRETKPEDAPNPGENSSEAGLKWCLYKVAQEQPSSEPQERPHAKVARARPVFKRMSGKRGPRD